ncbi:FHA domain-containing protein [Planctomycetota bacterium]
MEDERAPDAGAHAVEFCKSCQVAKESGAKHCPRCGRKVGYKAPGGFIADVAPGRAPHPQPAKPSSEPETPEQGSELRCACGHPLSGRARFCGQCGRPVSSDAYVFSYSVNGAPEERVQLQGDELMVGKTEGCGLRLSGDDYASRLHARVFASEGELLLEDLGSANGTFLRVRRPMQLEPGDQFLVGTTLVKLEKAGS